LTHTPSGRLGLRAAASLALAITIGAPAAAQAPPDFERHLGHRMLGTVRGWLDSLYYDSTFGGRDLDRLEWQAQQAIDTASTRALIFGAIAQFLQGLDDSHTRFIPPGLSVEVDYGWSWRMIADDCFVTAVRKKSGAEASGLRVGDKVLSIDGIRPTRANTGVIWYVYHLLSPRLGMRLYVERLDGTREFVEFDARIERRPEWLDLDNLEHLRFLRDESDRAGRVEHEWQARDSVALWRFTSFGYRDDRLDRYMRDARRYPWLILDLRGNPGGAVEGVTRLLGHFFDEPVPAFTQRWRDSTVDYRIEPRGRDGPYRGQVVVLLDSESASGAEITARVLQQHGRAMVVGDRSSGQVVAARTYSLGEGASGRLFLYGVTITVFDIVMPDGERIEGKGVVPNVAALPSGRDLAAGQDPAMQFALELAGVRVSASEAAAVWR
jgi:C-terminal processing protease CtpA/Prc